MRTRAIHGDTATDREGAAEHSGYSIHTIDLLAANRTETGFPEPVEVETTGRGTRRRGETDQPHGREWYALHDLDEFFAAYRAATLQAARARVAGTKLAGDPEELLNGPQTAAELHIETDTWRSWVRDCIPDWQAGRPTLLPPPDHEEPAPNGGVIRYWKRATVQTFVNSRRGRTAGAGRPKGGGATLNDLQAILDSADHELTVPDIMKAMSNRLQRPISRQTITRLRRKLREQQHPADS